MRKFVFILPVLFLGLAGRLEAQKEITVEDIWRDYTFFTQTLPGFNFQKDGVHYTRKIDSKIQQFDITTGQPSSVIFDAATISEQSGFSGGFDDYTFSIDEKKILLETGTEAIYRRSTQANFWVWDIEKESLTPVFNGEKQQYATFSPQADKVAFVHNNNLYYKDLITGNVVQITTDGARNRIINGATDWVYEEEFGFAKAFQWSPDGKKIAFMRFDETEVREFTMIRYNNELYPEYVTFKYPKVGEKNSVVNIFIYDVNSKKIVKADAGTETDVYFPRINWTQDPSQLCIFRMNRHQNELELLLTNANTGKFSTLLKETNEYYIDIDDDFAFLPDGSGFFWVSEKDGFNHIYLYDMKGKCTRQITKGNYDVIQFYGYDETRKTLYYQAAAESPMQQEIYAVKLDGKGQRKLTAQKGSNDVQFSSTYDFFVNTYSNANTPNSYTVHDNSGKEVRTIEDNAKVVSVMGQYNLSAVEFFAISTSEGVDLNAWMIKPPDFQPDREYPVLMYVYGGPGSQTVTDGWMGSNYWWFQMLAQKGYVVASVDNRGTGARGEKFKKMTYLELGKYETIDQIEAAKYLGSLPYIDANRIGIFGWSYGGYLSSLCLLKGNDVFKLGIAVAPVTNWKWYDTIYTERYMRTEQENPGGYKNNSPVNFADRLKGHYLLIHGEADDNVHIQNSAEMVNALIRVNKQFDALFYPNRNHGIYGGNTRLHLYTRMTNFLVEKL